MYFTQSLRMLHVRHVVIVPTLAVIVLWTVVVILMLPKTYNSATVLVPNFKETDAVTCAPLAAQLMPSYISTQVDIIGS